MTKLFMAIDIPSEIKVLNQNEFHDLDYQVMKHAFDIHNEMGNLWEEYDYQLILNNRLTSAGFNASIEAPIKVSLSDFHKTYFIDAIIDGAVYEYKTNRAIGEQYEAQTLNDLFLSNTHHGKIINFRPYSLEWKFISTQLTFEKRQAFNIQVHGNSSHNHSEIIDIVQKILAAFGAFLDIQLYKEAILHFLKVEPVNRHHRFVQLSNNNVIHITSIIKQKDAYLHNLDKLHKSSNYNELIWVNFHRNTAEIHHLK